MRDSILKIKSNCPVCKSTPYTVLFLSHNRRDKLDCSGTYVQCRACSLVYLRERPPWEDIVKFYSAMDADITANAGQVDVKNIQREVKKPVPRWKKLLRKVRFRPHSWPLESVLKGSKRLLDLGCGNGSKLFEFAERGYEVWGVDVGTDAIHLCRELLPSGHFVNGELQETGLPDAHFDYIRIDNALEHVPNPREVIRECHRLLKQGGQLLVYVPHGRSLSMRLMKGDSISSWIPFHLQLFTSKSLIWLMEDARFTETKIYGYYPTSWLPLSLIQWSNNKQPLLKQSHPTWLSCVCYPIGLLTARFGLAEELVGIATKK